MSDVCLCYGFKFKIYKLFQRIVLYSKLYEKQNILFLQCNAESHSRKNVFINNFKLFYVDFFFDAYITYIMYDALQIEYILFNELKWKFAASNMIRIEM